MTEDTGCIIQAEEPLIESGTTNFLARNSEET